MLGACGSDHIKLLLDFQKPNSWRGAVRPDKCQYFRVPIPEDCLEVWKVVVSNRLLVFVVPNVSVSMIESLEVASHIEAAPSIM